MKSIRSSGDETRHLLSGPSHTQALRLLDEFLITAGDRLIADPLKRAVLQHDLWAVFDWAAAPRFDGRDERAQTALMTRLARVIRRVALTRAQIEQLPDTYAEAARSDASLPDDLVSAEGKWVPIVGLATDCPSARVWLEPVSLFGHVERPRRSGRNDGVLEATLGVSDTVRARLERRG